MLSYTGYWAIGTRLDIHRAVSTGRGASVRVSFVVGWGGAWPLWEGHCSGGGIVSFENKGDFAHPCAARETRKGIARAERLWEWISKGGGPRSQRETAGQAARFRSAELQLKVVAERCRDFDAKERPKQDGIQTRERHAAARGERNIKETTARLTLPGVLADTVWLSINLL